MVRMIDLFAGIGGFHAALAPLGCEVVGFSEINMSAKQVYGANFGAIRSLGDLTKISQLPEHDLLTGGVPCQSWSKAGINLGFEDPRGRLWEDTIRVIGQNKPKAFILENVRGLTEPRHHLAFEHILGQLAACGYKVDWKVLSSSDFGVPQKRERVYLVGIQDSHPVDFVWPEPIGSKMLFEVLPDLEPGQSSVDMFAITDARGGSNSIHSWDLQCLDERSKIVCEKLLSIRRSKKFGLKDGNPVPIDELTGDRELVEELINKSVFRPYPDDRVDFCNSKLSSGVEGVYRVFFPSARAFSTLTATGIPDYLCKVHVGSNPRTRFVQEIWPHRRSLLRRLTPADALLLQGYPSDFKLHSNADTSLRLLGNSVTVPVIKALGEALFRTGIFEG